MATKERLKSFFAVTKTSVYRAVIDGEKEVPYLEKIACKGKSKVAIGSRISNGTMVSIGRRLQLFVPEGSGVVSPCSTVEREIAMVNTHYWGGNTSEVVALFLKEEDAIVCSKNGDVVALDPRWRDKTVEVLSAIGDDHPCCSISNNSDLRLMPKEEWFR